MGYSKIELYGDASINYLYVKNYTASSAEINEIVSGEISTPDWNSGTTLLATYRNSMTASFVPNVDGDIVGYKIQRFDVQRNVMYEVTETESLMLEDYNVSGNGEYMYYIFPIIEKQDENDIILRTLGAPIKTDTIAPKWSGCTIVGLNETDRKNEYTVDKDNIWIFEANQSYNDYVLNMDKTFTDGFGRFPKRNQNIRKYLTGGLSSLVGYVDCASKTFKSGISKLEKWIDFCHSSNLKLFKDAGGMVLPVDIQSESSNYLFVGQNAPITTSFNIVQLADYKEISVYSEGI